MDSKKDKTCLVCGIVETPYSGCPKCWGPVFKVGVAIWQIERQRKNDPHLEQEDNLV
jgi:hypothetical protein